MEKKVSVKLKFLFLIIAIICIMTAILGSFSNVEVKAVKNTESFENFEQLPENSSDTGSEFVKFDAYFESTDGKKYRGIRQELNEQVVLKTTLTVQTEGQLQNAQISWESNGNFSMIKNISTDDQIRSVSGNSIYFNTINNGTTKPIDLTFEQKVFDTFMDTFNVNLLSRTNKLTFSGNYIDKSGQTQKIKKEIEFRIDWYGSIDYEYEYGFWCYAEDNLFIVDEKEEKVYLVYNPWAFTKTGDTDTVMAPDAGLVISGTAPSIGGQYPTAIHVNDMSTYKKNIKEQSYDKSTGELKISIENPLSDAGKGYVIYGEQWYFTNIVMEYPIEVYDEIEATTNNIDFTASAYLEGWSTNINGEREKVQSKEKSVTMSVDVKNPKGSVLLYNIDIDESLLSKTNSRLIYDKNVDMKVNYKVDWNLDFYLYDEKIEKFVFAEDYSNAKNVLDEAYEEDTDHFADSDGNFYDMDPFIHYEGIRVSETTFDVLGENGIVYVYDADSDKVVKEIRYTDANELIKYDTPIEHIRIETSKPVSTGNIKIEHIKNIDNQILKTEHDKDEFEKFVKLYSTLHGLVKYSDEAKLTSINGDVKNVDYREGSTSYYPEFDKENYTFDPQKLNKNTMIIHFFAGDSDIDRQFTAWVNPTLYIEFPDNFTKVSYSSFSTSRVNVKVKKVKIEKIENHIVMKIETEGIITSNSDSLLKFQSLVENPTLESADRIRVFGYNSICEYYDVAYLGSSEYVDDIYDIDGDSNKNEKTRIEKPVIYYAQTDNLVTKTQITDFDELGSIVEGPNIASIIPSASGNKARVNILVSNGYSNPITGTVIVGRIPFVGNDHVINSSIELGSEFSTTMEETGIKIDENYKQNLSYKVYYSTDENATKDGSEWEEHPTDWENIKSYKIEISSEVPAKSNFSFYYWIDLPEKLSYGQKTYADHAIYFHSKGTSSETSTEPDKVGLQIGGQKYKLKISDYKFKTESLIPNATETVTNAEATFQIKGENLGEDWNNDKVTGNNPAVYDDLYVGAVYTVHQSKISDPYIRDENEIKFRLTTDLNGDLVFEILDEEEKTKEFIKATEIEDPESDVPTVRLDVQNKYKYNIVVENKVKGSEDYITGSKIKVEGEKQEKEDNIKVAEDGKATWENELEDTWTVTQEEVGNNKYVKDDKEHKFTVSRDEDGKIKLENLSELDDTTIRIENNDYEHQPTVYVIIENTYEAADIIATKTAKLILAEDEEERTYAVAGDFIEYTITVTNNGNKEGTAKIKDEIPAGTEFVDKSIKIEDSDNQVQVKLDGTDYTQQDLINGIDVTLEAGKSKTLTFRVKVLPLNEEETEREIINTAHIEDNDEEPGEDPTDDPKDNPTSEPIKEYASDLKVSKINNPDSETAVKVNDTITYTIKLDNTNGTAPAKTTVKDTAPEGTTFVENSIIVKIGEEKQNPSEGNSYSEDNLKNGISIEIPAHTIATVEFSVKVSQIEKDLTNGAEIKNVATVTEDIPNQEQPETHTVQVVNTYKEAVITGEKDAFVKLVDGTTRKYAMEGEEITYTITLTNSGDLDGTANVKDSAPEGTTFVDDSIIIKINDASLRSVYTEQELKDGIDISVPAKGKAVLEFRVKVNKITDETKETITNIATITQPDHPEPKPEDKTVETKTPVIVTKKTVEITRKVEGQVKDNCATMGDTIKYTIEVSNISEENASDIIIKDKIPNGTKYKSSDNQENYSEETNEITWTIDSLAGGHDGEKGETKTVSFEVTVVEIPEGHKIKNVATVGEHPTNETETDYARPEINITKSSEIENEYVTTGDVITYTLTITNSGKAEGTVTIKDPILEEQVELVEKSIKVKKSSGEEEPKSEGDYTAEDLKSGITVKVAPGEEKTLEFQVTVKELAGVEKIVNKGTYTVVGPNYNPDDPKPDPDPKDEHETNEVEDPYKRSDISMKKTVEISSEQPYAVPNDTLTYYITITNSGNLAKKVKVIDSAPDGTTFVEGSVKVGEEERTTVKEADLESGIDVDVKENSSVVVSFKVTVNDLEGDAKVGKIENIATVDGKETPKVETVVDKSDLKVSKMNDPKEAVTAGQVITYTILLDNSTGKAPATVKVKDNVPTGTDLVANSIKVMKYKNDEDTWESENQGIDDTQLESGISVTIDAGAKKKVEFKVKVKDLEKGATIKNVATVIDDATKEPEGRKTNIVENPYVETDIVAEKVATSEYGREYVIEGEKIKYTITLTNKGDLATTVKVKDTAPDNTEFVSDSIEVLDSNDMRVEGTYTEDNLRDGIDVKVEANSTSKVIFEVRVLNIENQPQVTIRNKATYQESKTNQDPEEPDPKEIETNETKTPVMKYYKTVEISNKEKEQLPENSVTVGDVIKYIITVENISEVDVSKIVVKDKIPEGTVLKHIDNDGVYNGQGEITWKISELKAGMKTTVSFEVTVNYQNKDAIIKNVAVVDGKETNEIDTPYKKPEPIVDHSVDKSGDVTVADVNAKVRYSIEYNAEIKDFKGKAKITMVDTLPFPIDDANSQLNGGHYQAIDGTYTITWEEILTVDSFEGQNNIINRIKNLELKYIYPDGGELTGSINNKVQVTVDLIQEENEEDVIVKTETTEDNHSANLEIQGDVIVHHYIYDEDKGGRTTDKLVEDRQLAPGLVGETYTTSPLTGEELDPNYECINPEPESDNHTGIREKETKHANYYYKLKDPTIENSVDKTAEIKVLTQENGVVKYNITQKVKVDTYKGKVTIALKDILPAAINKGASKLDGGTYHPESRTITWTIEKNIDTFTDGIYEETISKNIEIVYEDQNVLLPLENKVNAKVILYNPENYTPAPNEKRKVDEKEDKETVEQKYIVNQAVQKVWEDGDDHNGKRPSSIIVELIADGVRTDKRAVLNAGNNWTTTFENLDKYSALGNKIVYSVEEIEANPEDLLFYEAPTLSGENPIIITNRYRTIAENIDAVINKDGPEKITSFREGVNYTINYQATLTDYRGDAKLKIIDYLPYHIDAESSVLSDGTYTGVYDENTNTITWEISMNNINTDENGNYSIQFKTNIVLVFNDIDSSINSLSNKVDAILDLYANNSSNVVTDIETTPVDIRGKLIVHYKDKKTGEELTHEVDGVQQEYKYEEEGRVGDTYTARKEIIPGYVFDSVKGNEFGVYEDGTIEVTFYYVNEETPGIDVRWVDEDGNDLATPERIPGEGQPGKIGDPYHTEPKDFDDYELDYVEGETDGTLTEEGGEVVYHYKKKVGTVIVQYLEKDTEEELLPEKVEKYPIGEEYTTERENIPNYRRADPEPDNKNGIVTKEDTYVKYYYERIPGGKVVTKHVDVDTGEEILYPDEDTGEYETYREEQTGDVGDPYTTDPLDIPYYDLVEELLPTNQDGFFGEEDKEVIYFYRKQTFNFKVDKVITKAVINGEEQKVLDGKLIKVEIVGSEMEDTDVEITYKIRVTNTGEIAGTTTVLEKLPKHFTIGKEVYDEWTENKNGNLEAEVSLEPGETKEFTIKLTWKRGSANFGREINTAEIKDFDNDAHYDDNNEKDNTSEAEVVMSVKTGAPGYTFFIVYIIAIVVSITEVIIFYKRKTEAKL